MTYLVDANVLSEPVLERWFETGMRRLHVLPWEAETVAATALVHDLTMVTRNRQDFEKADLTIVDPFAAG